MTLFEKALLSKNFGPRPPVWLMRQAGRYMPSYQELRKKHTLNALFHDPELAANITLLPEKELGVDALVLFSDIAVIAELFGKQLDFVDGKGPVITPAIEFGEKLEIGDASISLSYVLQTIKNVKKLSNTPLIGFCGGPFTVLSYMMTAETLKRYKENPDLFEELIEIVTEGTVEYVRLQALGGIQAFQIFDSWANTLNYEEFLRFSWKPLKKIVDALKEIGIPQIIFCRGSSLRAHELSLIAPSAISCDGGRSLADVRSSVGAKVALQGNFDPELLLKGSKAEVEKQTKMLLASMRKDPGFIANLGSGVLPGTPYENVQTFVRTVREYK